MPLAWLLVIVSHYASLPERVHFLKTLIALKTARTLAVAALAVLLSVVSSIYAGAQSADDPVLFYDMALRGSPETMEDLSGNGSNGTLFNFSEPAAAYGEEDSATTTFLSFIGGEYIYTDEQRLPPSEFEIHVEFRTEFNGGKLVGFENSPTGYGTLADRTLYIANDGLLRFAGASGVNVTVPSLEPVTDGQWHTAIGRATFANSQVQYELILDGLSQGTTTGRTVSSYPGYWRVGFGNLSNFTGSGLEIFTGDISSVRIFDLSDAEPQPTPTPTVAPPDAPGSLNGFNPVEPGTPPWLYLEPGADFPDAGITDQIPDISGAQNHGTLFFFDDPASAIISQPGAPTVEHFVRFDGDDDVVGTDNSQFSQDNLTLSVWFRTSFTGGKIAGFENNIASGSSMADRHLYVDDEGFLRFGGHEDLQDSLTTFRSSTRVNDGGWHNAIVTLETSGDTTSVVMYLDGRLENASTVDRFIRYQGFWRLGGGNLDGWPSALNAFFSGDIGPLLIYEQALPPEQLAWLAQPPAQSSLDSSLTLWLDAIDMQGTDTIMFDLSGNGVFGALNNFEDAGSSFITSSSGPVSRFLRFDGHNDLVSTDTVIPAPNEFTMAVWFRTSEANGSLITLEDATPGAESEPNDRTMYIDSEGRLRFGLRSSLIVNVRSNERVDDGEWHFAVGTVENNGVENVVRLFIDGEHNGTVTATAPFRQYNGFWLIGNGTLNGWPAAVVEEQAFGGDFGSLRIYDRALTPGEILALFQSSQDGAPQPTPQPTATPFFEPDFPHEDEVFDIIPRVNVSSDIDGDSLTLDISLRNVDLFDSDVWVVREEDGEEFFVGTASPQMTWQGEAQTSRYTVEVRREVFGEPVESEEPEVLATGSVPVFHQPASPAQAVTAVAVTVAVAGAASAASASGTWIYELIWRFLRIFMAERLRRRTKNLDISSIPSSVAAVVAMVLMALLIAIGRPGSLELNGFLTALAVSVPAVILFRLVTILGGFGLAYYTNQKPKYLIWAAGTVSFAITTIVLQSPVGYTGYMERDPSDKERDARFATAGFAAILALSGLFVMIGLLTKMSFAETGVTLTLGVLAVTMLPFPLMGGNAIWKWNRTAGVASGVFGMTIYLLFQFGLLSPTTVVTIATVGLLVFIGFLVLELWLAEQERMRTATVAAEASAEGASAV